MREDLENVLLDLILRDLKHRGLQVNLKKEDIYCEKIKNFCSTGFIFRADSE